MVNTRQSLRGHMCCGYSTYWLAWVRSIGLLCPALNRRLQWNLPAASSLLGQLFTSAIHSKHEWQLFEVKLYTTAACGHPVDPVPMLLS